MIKYILPLIIFFTTNLYAADSKSAESSPKQGWGEFEVVKTKKQTTLSKILLWAPNRIMDFLDIFRLDVGAGFSTGAVVRISKHMQVGYRDMNPTSLRVGLFGREYPWLLETSNEMGVSPAYISSKDRTVCNSEIGAGADVIVVGAYAGICLEEIFDFIGGIFFFDLKNDDF